jgi:hypothetical protein
VVSRPGRERARDAVGDEEQFAQERAARCEVLEAEREPGTGWQPAPAFGRARGAGVPAEGRRDRDEERHERAIAQALPLEHERARDEPAHAVPDHRQLREALAQLELRDQGGDRLAEIAEGKARGIEEDPGLEARAIERGDERREHSRRSPDAVNEQHGDAIAAVRLEEVDARPRTLQEVRGRPEAARAELRRETGRVERAYLAAHDERAERRHVRARRALVDGLGHVEWHRHGRPGAGGDHQLTTRRPLATRYLEHRLIEQRDGGLARLEPQVAVEVLVGSDAIAPLADAEPERARSLAHDVVDEPPAGRRLGVATLLTGEHHDQRRVAPTLGAHAPLDHRDPSEPLVLARDLEQRAASEREQETEPGPEPAASSDPRCQEMGPHVR